MITLHIKKIYIGAKGGYANFFLCLKSANGKCNFVMIDPRIANTQIFVVFQSANYESANFHHVALDIEDETPLIKSPLSSI
jgi:hypothetical protein